MKRVCSVMVAAGLLVAGAAHAQGLADVARQEQERRKAVKEPARLYTEADLRKMTPLTTAAARPQAEPAGGPATAAPAAGAAATEAQTTAHRTGAAQTSADPAIGAPAGAADARTAKQDAPKTEDEWQASVKQARDDVARSQRLLSAMQMQAVSIGVQNANARSIGRGSRDTVLEQESVKEVERLRADIERHTATLSRLESEARTAGVPPGWVR